MKRFLLVAAMLGVVAGVVGAASAQTRFDNEPLRVATEASASVEQAEVPQQTGPSAGRIIASLTGVVALIVGLGWVYRRVGGDAGKTSTGGVRLVSRSLLTPKHQVMVLEIGHRLVVVGDAGHGMQPLCEVTDPAEVESILAASGSGRAADALRGDAFSASLSAAEEDADAYPIDASAGYGEHGDLTEIPPPDHADGNVELPDTQDVRALIERVRGLGTTSGASAS